MLLLPAALAAVVLSWCSLVRGQSQRFSVDLGAPDLALKPFDNSVVTRCFGSSHAATAMRADWQRELTQVQKDLGVEYVRFHGLLDDDMSVVVPGHGPSSSLLAQAPPHSCTFVAHQDFKDAGANIVNASSKEECCALCYSQPTGLPEPCAAAVFEPGSGRCYFKIGHEQPVLKPESDVVACVAVGETVVLRAPPSPFSRCFNMDGEGMSAK